MNDLEITTAHNVTIRIGYASIGERIFAGTIDIMIRAGYIFAVWLLSELFFRGGTMGGSAPMVIYWVACSLPFLFYSLLFEYFMGGQTPGKRAMKVKVSSMNGMPLGFGQCFLRWIFRIVDCDFMPGIGIVAIAVSIRKQRIGDLLAGTVVMDIKPDRSLDETIYTDVEAGRTAYFPGAVHLSPREIEIIKEVLHQYETDGDYALIPATASRVRTVIGAPDGYDDLSFLRVVVEDYYTLAAG